MTTSTSHQLPLPSPLLPTGSSRRPFTFDEVTIESTSFWGERQNVNATEILDTSYNWMKREGWIGNFRAAVEGRLPAGRRGREFTDSDVYKLLEALVWEHGRQPTTTLQARIREITSLIADAQDPDGYLNTMFGRPGQADRYSDLTWGHELYATGHLLQAAVAELRTVGSGPLTEVARRAANHVVDTFGPHGNPGICGHPEIEVGLIEFARATGDDRYRQQARLFLERRGHVTLALAQFGSEYAQDDIPIRDAEVLRGHAVRATYLAAAAADLAIDDNDHPMLDRLATQWRNTIARRTYLTGGMGARHEDEAFGADYELPSEHAYSETCAAVGALMWSWRLALATNDPAYADLAERLLYNVIATSPAEDGRSFFYSNTLHQRELTNEASPDTPSARASSAMRAPWFEVSCCPPNVGRTLSTLASYTGWVDKAGVTLALWSSMSLDVVLPGNGRATMRVETEYPNAGVIRIHIDPASSPWDLTVRIPDWAHSTTVTRRGSTTTVSPGWHTMDTVGDAAEDITIEMPMAPRLTHGDPRIDSARGAIAVERGPLVYALESVDTPGWHVDDTVVVSAPHLTGRDVTVTAYHDPHPHTDWPYTSSAPRPAPQPTREIRLTPYHQWGRRGPSTMRVWMRTK